MKGWWEEFIANGSPSRLLRQAAAEFDLLTAARQPAKFGIILFHTQGGQAMGEITVRDDETGLGYSVALLDAEGNPATPDSPPTAVSSDEGVIVPTPAEDGMSGTIAVGAPGSAVLTITATETHEGVGEPTALVFTGLVNVVAGDAVVGSVEFAVTPPEAAPETPPEEPPTT